MIMISNPNGLEFENMINVTKTYLPPLTLYDKYLKQIWKKGWITNHGPLVNQLERKLEKYLGVKHLAIVANGTIALQIAIKALDLEGEIITTPFSYVATTSSIVWSGCQPIFVDINPKTFCLDPGLISRSVSEKTSAIVATHVYGNPCDIIAIGEIAHKNKLKIIYDAAHAFGVKYQGESILNFGDISILSFHATKLFHTIEGGALVTNDTEVFKKILYMRNFGHKLPDDFWGVGINGKVSEFQAAMGLCVLPKVKTHIQKRKKISNLYNKLLKDDLVKLQIRPGIEHNYSYYPIIFSSEEKLLRAVTALNKKKIYPRRYFYPALTKLNYVGLQKSPVAEDIASRVLCLPFYENLKFSEAKMIAHTINNIC